MYMIVIVIGFFWNCGNWNPNLCDFAVRLGSIADFI